MKMRLFLVGVMSLGALSIPVGANGGGYHIGVEFTGSLAPFSPVGTERVQIMDEKLDVLLKHEYAEVNVRYLMHNESKRSAKVTFGFPVEDVENEWGMEPKAKSKNAIVSPDYCKNYQVTFNGNALKYSYIHELFASGKVKPFPGSDRFKGIKGWMVSTMKVPAGQNVIIEISYRSVYDKSGYSISDDVSEGPWLFRYRLSTGGVWRGPIKKGRVTVRVGSVDPKYVRISKPANRFQRRGDTWVWEFKNLEPTLDDDITIQARAKFADFAYHGDDEEVIKYCVRNDQWYLKQVRYTAKASSELPTAKEISYEATNVKRSWGDEAYAWVEGKDGDGIGESITLKLHKPTRLAALMLVNGYTKSENLFSQNSRVKEVTLVINGKQKIKLTLSDHTGQQWLSLNDVKEKISSIQLVIDSVYPGTQFKDTCISSLSLIEKLKEKPKHYGAR